MQIVSNKVQMKKRHNQHSKHSPTAVQPWLNGELAIWFCQTVLLTSCKLLLTLGILEVCFDSKVNNSINVIQCKLARKQVCTDKWHIPVSLQTLCFFHTVQRINWILVMSTVYFTELFLFNPWQSFGVAEENGVTLKKDMQGYICLPLLYLLVALPAILCLLWNLEDKIVLHVFVVSHGFFPADSTLLFASVTAVCPLCDSTQLL